MPANNKLGCLLNDGKKGIIKLAGVGSFCNASRLPNVMDTFDHPYYSLNKRLLSIVGQWPHQDPNRRLFSLCLITLLLMTFVVTEILLLYTSKGALEPITEAIAGLTLMATILIKYYACYFGVNKIKKLLDRIREEWQVLKSEEEIEIMENCKIVCSRFLSCLVYIYTTVFLSFSVTFIPKIVDLVAPLNESRPLNHILMSEYLVDDQEYFYPIFTHMSTVITVGITCFIATDAIFLVCTSHVCGVFATVGYRLEHLSKEDNIEKMSSDHRGTTCTRTVVQIVHAHRRAMEFANLMESFFSLPLFLISGMNIICLSVSLFRVAVLLGKSSEALKFIAFVLAQLFHMFCNSYPGQRIIDHSSAICYTAYSGLWYEAPLKVRKMLLMMIQRSFRPSHLTAGKILVFSLESFSAIVQTSMSYFMVLSSMQ